MSLCYLCKTQQDCRPYGENNQMICYDCAQSSSDRIALAESKMKEAFERAGQVVLIEGEAGPVPAAISQSTGLLHVYPVADVREHEISESCWCSPTLLEDGVIVHHSLDGREQYETGERKLN